ncbi:MAG: hypothetical protein IJO38_04060 [Akkermansia sp.]|nr:hypothetical protein [Akkermansia sp.]
MSQITLQGKQQALIRVAESRVAMLDAVSSTREHAALCVKALPVSPSTVMKIGAAAGAAASVLGAVSGLKRKKLAAEKKAARPASNTGMLVQLAMQLAAPLLLPKLQQFLHQKGVSPFSSDASINL